MKLIDLTVHDFINEVDSKSPAPGGGSVAALAGSIASALSRMVGHLTVGKKKFKALDEHTQNEFNEALNVLLEIKEKLVVLIDKDTEAFNEIMNAFKLPKETEEEKKVRSAAIENATVTAIEIPMEVATLCKQGMEVIDIIKKDGNKNCTSDLGVSMLMFYSGLIGAVMNVNINIPGLSNPELISDYQNKVNELLSDAKEKHDLFIENILK